ncbi:phage major capsid protein [uncultured Paracoccus sp.]|uniref:phage major capsid protein n=1 Tax=uncultured Paracoccus sp. TaxID=189685 RepID=UPI0025D4A963|nr:phage major capsid protein [uncultured Paracoccus sp.]
MSVPADPSVGVGRSARETPEATPAPLGEGAANETSPAVAGNERGQGMIKILRNAAGDLVRAKVDEAGNITEVIETLERAGDGEREVLQRGTQAERTRAATILNMGVQYDARDLAQEFVQNNRSPEEFQAELLTRMARQRGLNEDGTPIQTGLSADEVRRFSFVRALNALANPTDRAAQEAASFEYEASRAAAEATGRDVRGIMVPQEVLARAMMTTGVSGGNNLIETALDSGNFVDLLRARSVINRLATPLNGLVGNVDIPKLTQGSQGYWVGEGADATQSELVIGQIQIRPNTVGGILEATRRMMKQPSLDVENMFRRDLAAALGSTIDVAGLYGAGGATVPLGLANTPGVNLKELAAAYATFGEIVDMETLIAMDNADVSQMATVLSPTSRGRFKTTEKFAGTGKTIWEDGNTLNGYGTEVTTHVQDGDLFFGNFADMIFASWGGLDLTVDPYTKAASGNVRIVAFKDVDIVVRRGESFAYATAA